MPAPPICRGRAAAGRQHGPVCEGLTQRLKGHSAHQQQRAQRAALQGGQPPERGTPLMGWGAVGAATALSCPRQSATLASPDSRTPQHSAHASPGRCSRRHTWRRRPPRGCPAPARPPARPSRRRRCCGASVRGGRRSRAPRARCCRRRWRAPGTATGAGRTGTRLEGMIHSSVGTAGGALHDQAACRGVRACNNAAQGVRNAGLPGAGAGQPHSNHGSCTRATEQSRGPTSLP